MERSAHSLLLLLLAAGLVVALLPAAAATFGPQPGAPCEAALLATQVQLFCTPDAPTTLCCDPVVAAFDLGGGVPCLCRVAAEPQLVMAGLNATHLLALYTSCGGIRPGGAHLAAACQGPAPPAAVVSSPPPPSSAPARTNIGKAVAAHAAATFGPQPGAPCDPALLATQAALFCAPDMATAQCCEPVVAAVDLGGGVPCLCRVAAEPPLVMAGLNASHLLKLYTSCGGLQDGARFAAACEGLAPSPAAVVSSLPPSPSRRRKQATHDATALPPSSKKPSSLSPSPQQNVGAAPAESKSMELVFLVLGYVFTGVLYLSPIPTIWQIATTNEVGMYKPDVHVLTLGSCVIGLLYGVPDPFKKGPVIFNAVGILIQIVYLGIFFRSSTAAQRRTVLFHLVMIGGAVAMQALLVFLLCPQPRYRYMLSICVAGMTTGMYSGPVRQMLTVWATKNVNHMSIWMAGASLFSGIFRTVYAFLTRDWFGFAAYIIGAVSGLVQLTLFLTVKFRYQQQPGA